MHALAPRELPVFIAGPDGSDALFTLSSVLVVMITVWAIGYSLHLYSLPARRTGGLGKTRSQLVLLLTLIALLTGSNALWIIGLMLAVVGVPDLLAPLRSLADSAAVLADAAKQQHPPASPATPPKDA